MKAVTKFAAVLLGVILAAYGSVEVWLSRQSYDDPATRRFCAAWLCPGEFRDARTMALQQASAHGHAVYALSEFQRAVLLDSASAYRWADLAEAEMNARQVASAKYCYQRALAAGPGNPAILLRAADFAFRTNDREATIGSLSAILRNPELTAYYAAAFMLYNRMNLPISELLENAVPANSTAALAFLQFWMDGNKTAEADATWKWMLEHSLADEQAAGSYVAFLMRQHEPEQALSEWKRFNGGSMPGYGVTNWIFNGGFEQAPKPGPLDWHGIAASRVDDVAHDGQWSLKLALEGNENVYQESVVTPGRWRIRAYMKTKGLAGGCGLALQVYDTEEARRLNIHSDALTGTNDWTLVERTFVVGPDTRLLGVAVRREGPEKAGGAWIDSVELSPVR